MSELGERSRGRPSAQSRDVAPAEEAKGPNARFDRSQPLADPMAYVRHDREVAATQIQRSLKAWRKPGAGGGEAAGQHEVSQPGEPAEQEAGAVADHVAGELHGDGKEAGDSEKPVGKQAAPAIGAKLKPGTISLAKNDDKKGKKEGPVKGKPINLPAWKDVIVDIGHITSGHVAGGSRGSAKKDKFPPGMSPGKIESVVRNAYKVCKKLQTQGERVLVVGTADGLTIGDRIAAHQG